MELNFFNWLRNGVKNSVLLGVADAIEEIGVPEKDDQFHKRITSVIKQDVKKTGGRGQKRLGRSLKDLNPQDAA